MDGGGFILLIYAAWVAYTVGHDRGKRSAAERDAKFTELGRWLADAISGVRDNHKFHGDGIITTSQGRAKLSNGEVYVVSVEMERR